jgi:hypothetical protein
MLARTGINLTEDFCDEVLAIASSVGIKYEKGKLPEEYVTSKTLMHYFHLLRNQKPVESPPPAQDPLWWQVSKGNYCILSFCKSEL